MRCCLRGRHDALLFHEALLRRRIWLQVTDAELNYVLSGAAVLLSVLSSTAAPLRTTTRAHVIWIIWWAALITVTQVAHAQSNCMSALGGISIGVGVLVFVVSGIALCCTCGLQPWGWKTPLRVPCPYDHAFRCSTLTTSMSLMGVVFVISTEFVGKSLLLALVFTGVLTFHLTLVMAPEMDAVRRLRQQGAERVLKGIADPNLFLSGFNNFVNFHTTLAICIVLDMIARIAVNFINVTAYNTVLDQAEKDPSIECPRTNAIAIVPISMGMILCPLLLANTMAFTNEIREFVEGRIAVYLQLTGAQKVAASPPESKASALYLRPTLAGIETYMPWHMFTGFGAGVIGIFFIIFGVIGLVDALKSDDDDDTSQDDNRYETWNSVQLYGMQILYGLVFLWYCHLIQQLSRATFPKAEDLGAHQSKMREITADAKEKSTDAAKSEGTALQTWTKVRTVVQNWTWQQAAALVVHAITLGSGIYAADVLKSDPYAGGAAMLGTMLAVVSGFGILFAIFSLSSLACSNDKASGACCGCWLTVAHDESRRVATMNRSVVFIMATLTAWCLGFLCSCSINEDAGPRAECSDDIQSARHFLNFTWCLNLFLIMETVINDNVHLVFNPKHVDLPYPRTFAALAVTSNAYCILVNIIMVSSGHFFESDTNTCAVAGSHLLGVAASASMVYVSMFLNNEMNLFLRYATLKSRSSIAVEYFNKQHVLSAYTSSGGVAATLPYFTFCSFIVALLISWMRSLQSSFDSPILVPAVYEGMLWVFFILALAIQVSMTPGFLHPIVPAELIEKLQLDKPAGSKKNREKERSSRPASAHQQQPRRSAATAPADVVANPSFRRPSIEEFQGFNA